MRPDQLASYARNEPTVDHVERADPPNSDSIGIGRYVVCIGAAGVLLRLLGPAWTTGFPAAFPDSSSYLAAAASGLTSWEFWFGRRPPTYPFLIWLVGPSPRAVIVSQTLLAVFAWGWLMSTITVMIRSRTVAIIALVLTVAIAIETRWIFWNTALLTESLSATLAVGSVAAWWRWWDDPTRFRIGAATLLTIAWMLVRDANAVSLLAVAAPAFVAIIVMERRDTNQRRRLLSIALAAVVVVGAYSVTAQIASDRGETSFHNNVGLRWLPDPEMSAWMEARGMPLSSALSARSGSDAWADGEAMLSSPDLDGFRDWVSRKGRIAAAASFVVKAPWYLDRWQRELPAYTSNDLVAYDTFHVADDFPERPLGPIDPAGSPTSMYLWGLVAVSGIAVLWVRRRTSAWFSLFLFVPVIADLYLSYVADAVEVGRHLAGPMLRFSVVVVVVGATAIDTAIVKRRATDG
ncbi:MAG: hypothetical protein ABIP17_14390 [Ilumatobacteraceae bacterium]